MGRHGCVGQHRFLRVGERDLVRPAGQHGRRLDNLVADVASRGRGGDRASVLGHEVLQAGE